MLILKQERNYKNLMMNMQSMMKQAQKLQKQMEQSQAELAATEFVGKDRKSTRLNSSHMRISYAVFCLKKKKT